MDAVTSSPATDSAAEPADQVLGPAALGQLRRWRTRFRVAITLETVAARHI